MFYKKSESESVMVQNVVKLEVTSTVLITVTLI